MDSSHDETRLEALGAMKQQSEREVPLLAHSETMLQLVATRFSAEKLAMEGSVEMVEVVDSHIHLTTGWKDGTGLSNPWLAGAAKAYQREWTEADMQSAWASAEPLNFRIHQAIFVECGNTPALEEARWALRLCADPASAVAAAVVNVPCRAGAGAVRSFLDALRDDNGALPRGLVGARQVKP